MSIPQRQRDFIIVQQAASVKTYAVKVLIDAVCREMDVEVGAFVSNQRPPVLVHARRAVTLLARTKLHRSFAEIGRVVNRNHSVVSYQYRCAKEALCTDDAFRRTVDIVSIRLFGEALS